MHDRLASIAAVSAGAMRRYAYSGRTYLVLATFALACSLAVFLVGGLVDSDFASLGLLFDFLPVIAACIVPALGARTFAAEDGNREMELMLSLPLDDTDLVVGNWLAGSAVLAIALLLATPIAATVSYLGHPDWGSAGAGMMGALLLFLAFHAVTLLMSALTAQQTTAYLSTVVLLLALLLAGVDDIATLPSLPAWIGDSFRLVNPRLDLTRLASGRIEATTVFALLTMTAVALLAAREALAEQRKGSIAPLRSARLLALTIAGWLGTGAACQAMLGPLGALDATSERLYSFSPGTIAIAREAPPATKIDFYWTPSDTSIPSYIRDHAQRVYRMLDLIARRSDGRIELRRHDVSPDSAAEWDAVAAGVSQIPLSAGGSFMLGAVLRNASRKNVIPYFDAERAGLSEYDVALALSRLSRNRVPKVGVLSPFLAPSETNEPESRFAFLRALRAGNDVAIIPFFADSIPDDLDALVIVGEAPVKHALLQTIDQHVLRGKGLIALLDPALRFSKTAHAASRSATTGLDTIADLLAHYGLSFDASIVGDSAYAAQVASGDGPATANPYFILATHDLFATGNPLTAALRQLLLVEPGSFGLRNGAKALVTTSRNAGTRQAATTGGAKADDAIALATDGRPRVLAAVSGTNQTSAFTSGDSTADRSNRASATSSASIMAVADVDWILDGAALAGGGNDNLVFFSNMVEMAAGDRRLLSITSRTPQTRRFTRIAEMMRAARARTQADEAANRAVIDKVETTVAEILKATKAKTIADLPPEVRDKLTALYAETIPARKRQREIRQAMREDVEHLGRTLTALNVAAGPLAVMLLWGLARAMRLRFHGDRLSREAPVPEAPR